MMFSGVSLAGDVSFRTRAEVDLLAGTNLGGKCTTDMVLDGSCWREPSSMSSAS